MPNPTQHIQAQIFTTAMNAPLLLFLPEEANV